MKNERETHGVGMVYIIIEYEKVYKVREALILINELKLGLWIRNLSLRKKTVHMIQSTKFYHQTKNKTKIKYI